MTNGKAITPCESALTTGPTADSNRPSSPRSLVSELRVLLGVLDSRPKPTFTLSQVAVELKSAFSRYLVIYDDEDDEDDDDEDDLDEWLKESIKNLSFLAVNNRFPLSLSLEDYARIEVLTSLRGHDQYAMLLVHENKVLVEGQAGEHGKMAKGLFKSIAMEVGRVIRERKEIGERWVGA